VVSLSLSFILFFIHSFFLSFFLSFFHSFFHSFILSFLLFRGFILFTFLIPGSSRGRGPRAAGWFADYLEDKGNTSLKSLVLEGGIKGWAAAGEEYTQLMDGYDETVWRKSI
jgi:hypothetical protein